MVSPIDPADLAAAAYADEVALLIDWMVVALADLALNFGSEMPDGDQLGELLPFVHVQVIGGAEINPAQDRVNVDVDLYWPADGDGNPDVEGAMDTARMIRAALLEYLPGHHTAAATVSAVRTFSRPVPRPYDDASTVRRINAAYQLVVKSH